MKRTIRTFVAVEIGAAVRQRAGQLIEALAAAGADVKWVEPPNLHLTLQFLDEVAVAEIPRSAQAVGRGTAAIGPFDLEVRGGGAFPNRRPAQDHLARRRPGQQQMIALHDAVEAALGKLGFRKEHRRFEPHLTLGRVRTGGPAVTELGRAFPRAGRFPGRHLPRRRGGGLFQRASARRAALRRWAARGWAESRGRGPGAGDRGQGQLTVDNFPNLRLSLIPNP